MSGQRVKTRPESVMEDPGAVAVAGLYARSYLAAAKANAIERPEEELASFVDDVLGSDQRFADLLCGDFLNRDEKLAIVQRVIAPQASPYFVNFLQVLIRHGRFGLIRLIRQLLERAQEELAGRRRVSVRTARALSERSRGRLQEQLRKTFGFEPILQESVDESLVGGLTIQVGDTIYDSSLRSRLKQLRGRLVEKALNEIQSRRDRFSHSEGD